jgi:hypothetical protein
VAFDDVALDEAQKVHDWFLQLSRKYGEPKAGDDDFIQQHLAGVLP